MEKHHKNLMERHEDHPDRRGDGPRCGCEETHCRKDTSSSENMGAVLESRRLKKWTVKFKVGFLTGSSIHKKEKNLPFILTFLLPWTDLPLSSFPRILPETVICVKVNMHIAITNLIVYCSYCSTPGF